MSGAVGSRAATGSGVQSDYGRILAGFRVAGTTDSYVKRNPRMMADACEAIERHYFGGTA